MRPCAGNSWLNSGVYRPGRRRGQVGGRSCADQEDSSDSPAPLFRSIQPRASDDEAPACKARRVVSPVIPEVSTRTVSSTMDSSARHMLG